MQADTFTDETGRTWTVTEGAHGSAPTWRRPGEGVRITRVALWFESDGERRTVSAPMDWRDQRVELLPRLFAHATPRPNDD